MDAREIQLPAGTIRYREAGSGPTIVFVHGYLVDGRLWDGVVDALADRFRCIVPDLADGRPPGGDGAGRRPHPARRRDDHRRLPRGARPRGRDPGRQRLRRRDLPGARRPPPRPRRPPRPHQLRHPRELPAGDLQGDAAARQAARRRDDAGAARSASRRSPHRLPPLRQERAARRAGRVLGRRRASPTRRSMRDLGKVTRGHRQAPHARRGGEPCAAPTSPCCSPGRPATASSRSATPNGWPPKSAARNWCRIPDSATFVPLDQPQAAWPLQIADFAPSP